MAKKNREKLRGASRMLEQGYKLVQVWLDPSEAEVIVRAAKLAGKKLATFVREGATAVAADTLAGTKNQGGGSQF